MRRSELINGETLKGFLEALESASPVNTLTHTFYRYPARFSPEVIRSAIKAFSRPGDVVLDPFMGGGTTVVEALSLGRRCIGLDINPLAVFVSRVKTTPLSKIDIEAIANWALSFAASVKLHSRIGSREGWKKYQANVSWWIRKTLEAGLVSTESLGNQRQRSFARCTLLKTAQWALDCRAQVPSKDQFLNQHLNHVREMIEGALAYQAQLERVYGKPTGVFKNRQLLGRSAAGIDQDGRLPKPWGAPRLVITSPPYMGVHILYHRWQVMGRRETGAPYWLAGCEDGNYESYYTFCSRKRKDQSLYLDKLYDCFSSIVALLNRESLIIQLVAFARPEVQLSAYLKVMKDVGLVEVQLPSLSTRPQRLTRMVPNRKWYACRNANGGSSIEFLLMHRRP